MLLLLSSIFSNNFLNQITDVYSEPACNKKKLNSFQTLTFLQNTPSQMFDRILNMPLDYFSCLVLVLRWMHEKFDICPTDYSVHSNLKISLYSEVINGSTTFRLMEDQQTLKKNDQLLSLMVLFFLSFSLFQCPIQKVL